MSNPSIPDCTVFQDGKKSYYEDFELTRGQSIGLALTAESGLISILSVTTLFLMMFRNIYRNARKPPEERRRLIQRPADVFVLSLFLADLLQAIGAAIDARWAHTGTVRIGPLCTAQGVVQQLGEASVAINTLLIAVQTFIAIWFRKFLKNIKLAVALVALAWLYIILFVAIGAAVNRNKGYEIPTPYWCWIGANYLGERIAGEYLWLWLALLVSVVVYIPLVLWSRGYIVMDKTSWLNIRFRFRPLADAERDPDDKPPTLPLAILGYPFIYSIVILPLSLVRWSTLPKGNDVTTGCTDTVPSAAAFFAVFLFGLSGAANVLLMLTTRPNLLLFGPDPESKSSLRSTVSSSIRSQVESERFGDRDLELSNVHGQGHLPDESESDWN